VPPDRVQDAIKQLRSIDPSIDTRPGTNVRTLIEVAVRGTEMLPLPVDYGPTMRPERRITLSSLTDRERDALAERHRYNAIAQMQAHEDQLIYAAFNRFADEWRPARDEYLRSWGTEYMGTFANPNPSNPPYLDPAYSQTSLYGVARDGRSTERVAIPAFPIESNPTININEIRARGYTMIDRTARIREQTTSEMTLEQMNRVALIVRKTAWERILAVEELEFSV
jgi:hypothetical protein